MERQAGPQWLEVGESNSSRRFKAEKVRIMRRDWLVAVARERGSRGFDLSRRSQQTHGTRDVAAANLLVMVWAKRNP
jgi:hypothetical protein